MRIGACYRTPLDQDCIAPSPANTVVNIKYTSENKRKISVKFKKSNNNLFPKQFASIIVFYFNFFIKTN